MKSPTGPNLKLDQRTLESENDQHHPYVLYLVCTVGTVVQRLIDRSMGWTDQRDASD